MTTADTNQAYQFAHDVSGAVRLGVWTQLTATYKASTGMMALYVNGNPAGTTTHTSPWNATGKFQIGAYRDNDTYTRYFNGQIANVQVWNRTLTPLQAAKLSGTPGYILFPSDNTAYATGMSWTSECATMTFNNGLLSITVACASTGTTTTFGSTGHPAAVLRLQNDGNLVIYDGSTVLWATNVYPYPGDTLFLQNDGNLVLYNTDGGALWASNTTRPAAAWNLSEPAGTIVVNDASGNARNATANTVTLGTPGRLLSGPKQTAPTVAQFNGTTSYATTTAPVVDTAKSLTISAWVKLTNTSNYASVEPPRVRWRLPTLRR